MDLGKVNLMKIVRGLYEYKMPFEPQLLVFLWAQCR